MNETKIPYERLLIIAKKMHFWIWDHSFNEQEVYDELGLTEEENYILGYGGKIIVAMPEPPCNISRFLLQQWRKER